jgi:hypothetical protein
VSRSNEALKRLDVEDVERFMVKVARGNRDVCWPWKAAKSPRGYGRFKLRGAGMIEAHRVAFFVATDIHPRHGVVCHACDNPSCCNPAHLFLGTQAANLVDMDRKGRRAIGRTHGLSRLTSEATRQIRVAFAQGQKQSELARRFGVSQQCISDVVRGRRWRHTIDAVLEG